MWCRGQGINEDEDFPPGDCCHRYSKPRKLFIALEIVVEPGLFTPKGRRWANALDDLRDPARAMALGDGLLVHLRGVYSHPSGPGDSCCADQGDSRQARCLMSGLRPQRGRRPSRTITASKLLEDSWLR